ncbi:PhzF family phenazine biosynthesis protein [Streptacidiphilus sp. BW17]|uniref:PhzF family phenazine biosynthesis protein n=1 Tax=Streptacidiphilus sp. BW17 TaxID=3156274 RepID=UPI003517D378
MRIRIIDAFTDEPFAGNPAAVCLLPPGPWPDERWMRRVATELNLSETAFARPLEGAERDASAADWALRWFTPAVEVGLCGHATLATVHALAQDGRLSEGGRVAFASMRSGVLRAETAADGAITLDFPANPTTPGTAPEGLTEALGGASWLGVHTTGALGDLLVELATEAEVRDLHPHHTRLETLDVPRGVIVTAPAEAPEASGYAVVSRWFGVSVDVGEDPVTGSAHTALGPFWAAAERLGRAEFAARQVSPRGGTVRVRVDGDRVLLTGRAVTVLDGTLAARAGEVRSAAS